MQFPWTLIDASACPTQVLVAVVFLLGNQQCTLYESVNDRIELRDIFNYIRNSVLIVNLVLEKSWRYLSRRYCWIKWCFISIVVFVGISAVLPAPAVCFWIISYVQLFSKWLSRTLAVLSLRSLTLNKCHSH